MAGDNMEAMWGKLSQSVYGDSSAGRMIHGPPLGKAYHPADEEIHLALQRREEARVRIINALERAGATPNTLRQVEEVMDRRSVTLEQREYIAYRKSWNALNGVDHSSVSHSSIGAREVRKVGLECELDKMEDGTYIVSAVYPGGACAAYGIKVGSTILTVDGVPLRAMTLEEVKQLTVGLVGTHVCVRYRPPGSPIDYPPAEKIMTRMRAPSMLDHENMECDEPRAQENTNRQDYDYHSNGNGSRNSGVDPLRSLRSSVADFLTGIGSFVKGDTENSKGCSAHANGNSNNRQISFQKLFDLEEEEFGGGEREKSVRALQRAEFLNGLADRDSHSRASNVRNFTDQLMLKAGNARPVTIPPSYDMGKCGKQSVPNRDFTRVVDDILDRRSRRFAQLLQGHPKPSEELRNVDIGYSQDRNDLEAFAHDSRQVTASSVLRCEGLESGRNYLYKPVELEEYEVDTLNPVVLDKERKSLFENLKNLEESLSRLTQNEKFSTKRDPRWTPEDEHGDDPIPS